MDEPGSTVPPLRSGPIAGRRGTAAYASPMATDSLPTLTICVPTFGRPALVQRAIRSIIESAGDAHDEVEIIVSDNSPEISEGACRRALKAWPGRSLYLGNSSNGGAVANFNQCIDRASGTYILFVHDDDRLLPNAVSDVLRALGTPEAPNAVLFFGVRIVDEAQRTLRRQQFCRDVSLDPPSALLGLLSDTGIAWFPGLVVSREAYAAVGPFDAEAGNATDLEMWVRLFSVFGLRCVPSAISAYSVHVASATQTSAFDEASIARILAIFARAEASGVLSPETIAECRAQFLPQVIIGSAAFALRAGHADDARQVMALFDLPAVRSRRLSLSWRAVRLTFAILVRAPSAVVGPLLRSIYRVDLVYRVRALRRHGEGTLPFC